MITNSKGTINLQSALDRLVAMGKEDPNILMKYAQNPPASLGSNAGLLVNMAANMVGDQRQRAQAQQQQQQGQQPTVMEQGIAKLAPQMPPQMMAQAPQMPSQAPMAPPQMMAEGGLAQLDVGDMFNEANYASGGIVAFEDGGDVRHYDGLSGSYVEGREYPNYAVEEEPTSFFDRTIGRYMDREKEMMLADDAIEKYKLEKGVMPWTKQKKAERDAYDKGLSELQQKRKEAGKSIFSFTTPTVGVTADKYVPPKEDTTNNLKKQVDQDKANQNALKKANDNYLNTVRQTNADQISSYDQAMQKVMDLAKNDPYRDQLRAEYDKEKSGAFYDVLGDIGTSLVGAKKGQEGQALQQGLTAANARVKDLRKQKRDLMLAEQKADRDYQMLGAKYGFDSEQARAALAAKERMAEAENKVKLEYGNIVSGGRDRKLQLEARGKYDKALADWSKGEGLMTVQYANMKPTGDKKHDAQITQAKQVLANKMRELQLGYGLQDVGNASNAGTKVVDFNDLYKP